MKNLLIYYTDGTKQAVTNLTPEQAQKYIDLLETEAWVKIGNTYVRSFSVCRVEMWGDTCKDCGYYQETSLPGYGACGNPDRDEEDVVEENRKACEGAIP